MHINAVGSPDRAASARSSRSELEATNDDEKKQQPTNPAEQDDEALGSSSDSDVGSDEEQGAEDHRPQYSKVRLVSLVLTVTCAAFLNVGTNWMMWTLLFLLTDGQTLGVQAAVVVLPTIGRELDIPDSRQQWIVSAYSLTFGCFMLLWGRLADVYGKRLIFVWGSAWLTVTTMIIPFVKNEIGFDVLRGLQGLVCLVYKSLLPRLLTKNRVLLQMCQLPLAFSV